MTIEPLGLVLLLCMAFVMGCCFALVIMGIGVFIMDRYRKFKNGGMK